MRHVARVGLAGVLVAALGAPAYAAWSATSSGAAGTAKAGIAATGTTPVLDKRLGRDVLVSWPATTTGAPTYTLTRDGAALPGCTGLASTVTSCRDNGVTATQHAYAVVPDLGLWPGAAGSSLPVTVPPPSLAITQPASSAVAPTALAGTVDAFLDEAALTYRLDASDGPVLLGSTPTSFPTPLSSASSGAANVSLPIGCGKATVAPHAHEVFASAGSESASSSFTFNFAQVLCPSSITSSGGSTPRTAEAGDAIKIVWSRNVQGSSICSDLSGTGASSTPDNNLTVTITDGGAANDSLQVTAPAPTTLLTSGACGSSNGLLGLGAVDGTINVGLIDLGSTTYVGSGSVVFRGTSTNRSRLSFNGTNELTITLGTRTSGTVTAGSATGIARYPALTSAPYTSIRSALDGKSAQGFMTSSGPLL